MLCAMVLIPCHALVDFHIYFLRVLPTSISCTWYIFGGYLWTSLANRPLSQGFFLFYLHRGVVGNGGDNLANPSGEWKGCRSYFVDQHFYIINGFSTYSCFIHLRLVLDKFLQLCASVLLMGHILQVKWEWFFTIYIGRIFAAYN